MMGRPSPACETALETASMKGGAQEGGVTKTAAARAKGAGVNAIGVVPAPETTRASRVSLRPASKMNPAGAGSGATTDAHARGVGAFQTETALAA